MSTHTPQETFCASVGMIFHMGVQTGFPDRVSLSLCNSPVCVFFQTGFLCVSLTGLELRDVPACVFV